MRRGFRHESLAFAAACLCWVPLIARGQSGGAPEASRGGVFYANPLVGTAPLDRQELIGNAPPPGEQLYSGFTSPSPMLPHSSFEMTAVNANLALEYPGGIAWPYYYPNQTMFGFSAGGAGGPILMPVVGDWTVPPDRPASTYDKASERASPGFYAVDLDASHTRAELTATMFTELFRFTYPASGQGSPAA